MTVELETAQDEKTARRRRAPGRGMRLLTRLVLFWERFWPTVLPALSVPFTIIVISLFNLWRFVPAWLHWTSLGIAAVGLAALLARDFKGFRLPSRRDVQMRLEEDGRTRHAPLQALDDQPFDEGTEASPLWQAHMQASAERARAARLAGLRKAGDRSDPWGLRHTALGLLAVALIAAGNEWKPRLGLAFTPGSNTTGGLIADLWIEPPAYTGRAPIYLLRAGEEAPKLADQIDIPQGSTIAAQANGRGRLRLSYTTQADEISAAFERNGAAARADMSLTESGLLTLRLNSREAHWPIGIIPDRAPSAYFIEEPTETDDARLTFTIAVNDDYGVASAQLALRLAPDQDRPLDAPDFDTAALSEIRLVDLEGAGGRPGERSFIIDLQSDPWAGLTVLARVIVKDAAEQIGETEEIETVLPTRRFFNPLAKTVIEQRQTLAVATEDWSRTGRSFDAITMAPEVFFENTTDYLLLRTAFWRVMRQDGEGFDDAVEKFWPLALQLEDQALELARQRLEAAQEALRQALERGASDEEIAGLVEQLRQAMNDYLQALAQSGQPAPSSGQQSAQQLNQSDLDEMLDAIRDLAQSGAANAARQMLSDLENMLNNLRLSQGGGGSGSGMPGGGGEGEGGPAGQAGEIIGRQRELADESFGYGQTPGSGDGEGDELAERQGELTEDLNSLLDALRGDSPADPNGQAGRALGEARNDMREAEQALRGEDFDAAASAMARAIENLRDGAEDLVRERMRRAQQDGEGQSGGMTDPLGRPVGRAQGGGVEVPEESEAGRSRAVIDELRRRLGEQGRDEDEIEYLERLLERF